MKVVNKYELAKCPYGTMFYEFEPCRIKRGPFILTSHSFEDFKDTPMFNGMFTLEPNLEITFNFVASEQDTELGAPYWETTDIDSVDYSSDDQFLVLEKDEALDLVSTMLAMIAGKHRDM